MKQLIETELTSGYDIIVFCHLRWDFVYQRPQHLISRLSAQYKILVIEEPIGRLQDSDNAPEVFEINAKLHVMRPHINDLNDLAIYMTKWMKKNHFEKAWFYSAAFVPVFDQITFDTVIYDCMDELTLFKGSSPELISQETKLLEKADVVFTGGKSLYEAKKVKHVNVYCFPSSVDIEHFSNLNSAEIDKPDDLKTIPAPIIGYFGVIDERIDLDLLKETARIMKDHSFVMIGPICKIGEEDLPRAKNIFYLGMKTYEELPIYLKYFEFAMMPFALNDSTKFISPTKTLEYMAGGKSIISTKIKDVVRDYSNCVNLIETAEDFCKAIKNPINGFEKDYEEILENTSWDITAEKMSALIEEVTA